MPLAQPPTSADKYRRPGKIQLLARVENAEGGSDNTLANPTWTTVCSPFVHVFTAPRGRGATRVFYVMQLYPEATHWAAMRYRASTPIDATMTLLVGTHRFQIVGAVDLDIEHIEILLALVEYQARGSRV
jgi:hypothetical protein